MEYLGAWETLIHEKNLKSKISCQTPFKIVHLVYRCAGFSWCSRCAALIRARCVRPSSSWRNLTRSRRSLPRLSWPRSPSCKLLRHTRARQQFMVVDPYWFNAGVPDLALFLIADPDPQVGIQGFDDQKLEKIYSWKKLDIFLIKNCNLVIPRPRALLV